MKRFGAVLAAIITILLVSAPVLAGVYSISITLSETGGSSWPMLPIGIAQDNVGMVTRGFLRSDAQDSRVLDGTTPLAHMVTDNVTWFAGSLPAHSTKTFTYTTGNAPVPMQIVPGYGGYVQIPYYSGIEPGNIFDMTFSGYFFTDTNTNILGHSNMILYNNGDGVTFELSGAGGEAGGTFDIPMNISGPGENNRIKKSSTSVLPAAPSYGEAHGASEGEPSDGTAFGQSYWESYGSAGYTVYRVYAPFNMASVTGHITAATVDYYTSAPGVTTGVVFGHYPYNTLTPVFDPNCAVFGQLLTSIPCGTQFIATSGLHSLTVTSTGIDYLNADSPYFGFLSYDDLGGEIPTDGSKFIDLASVTMHVTTEAIAGSAISLSASIGPGYHTLRITGDGETIHLYADGNEADGTAQGSAAITDDESDWTLMSDGVPYLNYFSLSSGSEILRYEPSDMIFGDNLPDLMGNQNGVIVWGTNVMTISAAVGPFNPGNPAKLVSAPGIGTGDNLENPTMPPSMYTEGDVSKFPFGTAINEVLGISLTPWSLWWYPFIFLALSIIGMLVYEATTKGGGEGSLLTMCIVMEAGLIFLGILGATTGGVKNSLIPLFASFLFPIPCSALVVSRKHTGWG